MIFPLIAWWIFPWQNVNVHQAGYKMYPLVNIQKTMYPLVNVNITMERSTIFTGKTHYFMAIFNSKPLNHQIQRPGPWNCGRQRLQRPRPPWNQHPAPAGGDSPGDGGEPHWFPWKNPGGTRRNWLYPAWWTNILPWKDPPFFMGKSTISMAIFNCELLVHQRVNHLIYPLVINQWLLIEGSLEVKLPTIWTVEKQRWEESEEKRSEERRCRCAKR